MGIFDGVAQVWRGDSLPTELRRDNFGLRLKHGFDEVQDENGIESFHFGLEVSLLDELDVKNVVNERKEEVELRGD